MNKGIGMDGFKETVPIGEDDTLFIHFLLLLNSR